MTENDTEQRLYRLQDGITKAYRSGLILEEGETIEAYPDILDEHDDVLVEVEDGEVTTASTDDGGDGDV